MPLTFTPLPSTFTPQNLVTTSRHPGKDWESAGLGSKSLRTHSTEHRGHRAEAARDDGKLLWKTPRPEGARARGKVTFPQQAQRSKGNPTGAGSRGPQTYEEGGLTQGSTASSQEWRGPPMPHKDESSKCGIPKCISHFFSAEPRNSTVHERP